MSPDQHAAPLTRLLLVEDEPSLSTALSITLKTRHYDVQVAANGAEALALAQQWHPDVIVLDLGLPDMDGVDVLTAMRTWSQVPVLVLSARNEPEEKVAALDAGGDDYVTKPFSMEELLARLRVAMRHADSAKEAPAAPVTTVHTASFSLDVAARKATKEGKEVRLTPTEWALLEHLVAHPGKLIPGPVLLTEVWGPTYVKELSYLRVYMAQLRRKLEKEPANPRHLITEAGMGYRFEA